MLLGVGNTERSVGRRPHDFLQQAVRGMYVVCTYKPSSDESTGLDKKKCLTAQILDLGLISQLALLWTANFMWLLVYVITASSCVAM